MSIIPSIVPTGAVSRTALLAALTACCLGGCAVYDEPPRYAGGRPPAWGQPAYPDGEPDVVSVYVEPPMYEPEPIAVPWGPPPMLVERVPSRPYPDAVWVGGYWVWQGRWVWATGRWAPRPRPNYAWVRPYYEQREGAVIFIPGHWNPPGVAFAPPPPGMRIRAVTPGPGLRPGPAPMGHPPGSRPPPNASVEAPPAGRPFWRGGLGQPGLQAPPREQATPREEPVPASRGRDRLPGEFQRRPAPPVPMQATPAPATPAPAAVAAPPGRREEGPRRMGGPRGDRDRKDPKSE